MKIVGYNSNHSPPSICTTQSQIDPYQVSQSKTSDLVVTVIRVGVHVPTQATLEHVSGLDLHSFWAFVHLVTDLCAVVADVDWRVLLRQLLKELLRPFEVLIDKDLWMVIYAFGSFLAEAVHVVPAQLADYVLQLALLA